MLHVHTPAPKTSHNRSPIFPSLLVTAAPEEYYQQACMFTSICPATAVTILSSCEGTYLIQTIAVPCLCDKLHVAQQGVFTDG